MMRNEVLPDHLCHGLKIVFCGTAAGKESAKRVAYYAGPGNSFWSTLHKIELTPRRFAPEEWSLLTQHGIGLTDLAKTTSGSDSILSKGDFDVSSFRKRICAFKPAIVAFNGKKAAAVFYGNEDH